MQYNLWFNICAVIVLAQLLIVYYLKYNAPFKKYTVYLFLLWCAMISTVSSLTNNILPGYAPSWIIRGSNMVYFIAHGLIPPALYLYVYSLTDYNLQDWKRLIPWLIPSAFGVLMILTCWFSNSIFWLDEQGGYHRGPLLPLLYLITAFYFGAIVFTLFRNKRMISRRERISIFIFLAMASSAMLYQMIWPRMLVENFISATCMMISQMTVQNPEMILDGATGMLNKQGFSSLMAPRFERNQDFSVGFLMVDNYHELEKSYGFDRLESKLLVLAEYLKMHTGYTFARMDNRIFCFVDENLQSGDACDELLRNLEGERIFRYLRQEGVGVRFRIKTGLLTCPADVDSFSNLIDLIDIAGKLPQKTDAMRLSTADVLNLRRRKQIDELVRNAVADNMLHLVYQPIYCISGKRFCSAEALLRMSTEKLGNISPMEFIQIAEENGSIVQMTQFVVDSVCRLIQNSNLKDYRLRRIHINLSTVDCMQSDLSSRILSSLERAGVETNLVSVEITETAFSSMPDSILSNLNGLSEAGMSVMLDDYGTGYSNLSRLVNVPLNVVKLDKSLVRDIMTSEPARIILDNTVHMMKRLGKRILVEGVETREQADYVIGMGCDYIQGFYYARPMEAAQLEELLCEQAKREEAEKKGCGDGCTPGE